MIVKKIVYIVLLMGIVMACLSLSASAETVYIEYFHKQGCSLCAITDPIMEQIVEKYNDNKDVRVEYFELNSTAGLNEWEKYHYDFIPLVVVNNKTIVSDITEDNLNYVINTYLMGQTPKQQYDTANDLFAHLYDTQYIRLDTLAEAFSLGIISGFSPCLMAILAFILAYTSGHSERKIDGLLRSIVFGLGLVAAYIVVGIVVLTIGSRYIDSGQFAIASGIISIAIGIYLLGFIKLPFSFAERFKELSRKNISSLTGVFFMGILFSFLKVPCSAPALLLIINNVLTANMLNSLLTLLSYSLGILMPFFIIGLIGGYGLAEFVRSYRTYINIVSGLIIILLGLSVLIHF